MCVCLFSALSRRVGALQISIIIIINLRNTHQPKNQCYAAASFKYPIQRLKQPNKTKTVLDCDKSHTQ